MTLPLLPTTVVGSYPQPAWLVDQDLLARVQVPRFRMPELWRVPEPFLEEAQDDATIVAIREMEQAGIDIITDGEMRRESYSNKLALELDGIDREKPGKRKSPLGSVMIVPRVGGPIRRSHPIEVRDVEFLRKHTDRMIKITLPGPFTMAQQAENDYYPDDEAMVMDYARAVQAEAKDLKAAGADVIQLDEPWLRANPEAARQYAVKAIDLALEGVPGPTAIHLCFGYAQKVDAKSKSHHYAFLEELGASRVDQISIEAAQAGVDLGVLDRLKGKTVILGVIDLMSDVESAALVAERIRAGLKHVPADKLILAPDCGMKYLTRARAFGKLKALAEGAAIVRRELAG